MLRTEASSGARRSRARAPRLALIAGLTLGLTAAPTAFALAEEADDGSRQKVASSTESPKATAAKPKRKADTVMLGGRVLRYKLPGNKISRMADVKAAYSSAVAVRNGKIVYVGKNKGARALIGRGTNVIKLKGKLVMPGMIDTHIHGLSPRVCDLNYMPATDLDAVLSKIKDCLERDDQQEFLDDPNSLLQVSGFSSTTDPDQAKMNRYVLDRLSADPSEDPMGTGTVRPINVGFSGGHSQWLNSRALEIAGIDKDTPNPPGGDIDKDADGTPTGKLTDVSGFTFGVTPPLAPELYKEANIDTIAALTETGVTGAFIALGSKESADTWASLAEDGDLTMFINQGISAAIRGLDYDDAETVVETMNAIRDEYDGTRNVGKPGELVIDSAKVRCDGVTEFPGQTAAMYEPYNVNIGTEEEPEYVPGTERGEDPSCEDSVDGFQALHDNRWSIMTHSLGDRAVGDSLDNFQTIGKTKIAGWDPRHVVTHGEFVRPSDARRFGKIGAIYNPQAQWASQTGFMEYLIRPYVSEQAWDTQFPMRSTMESGGVVAGGSDWPVDALNPWLMVQTAISRQSALASDRENFPGPLGTAAERLSRIQSVFMHTYASAFQLHQEKRKGSIAVGKDADLIVANQNIMSPKVSVHDIYKTQPVITMYQGNIVFKGKGNAPVPSPVVRPFSIWDSHADHDH